MATPFIDIIKQAPLVLGQGSVLERLNRMESVTLDPHVANAALVYDAIGRRAMADLYHQYLDVGQRADLPMLLTTPTWRANRERIAAAGLDGPQLLADCVDFTLDLRARYQPWSSKVQVGGLLACRGDAYRPDEALAPDDAKRFHDWQVGQLAQTPVDYLRGATLPAMSEALGLAGLLAECGKPYVLSFIIRPDGTLLDGNALDRVVHTIDDSVGTPPVFYALNCVHPSIVISALEQLPATVTERLWGLLANAAALSPEQLDCATTMIADEPEPFAAKMLDLKMRYGMKILGGCCGTDQRHIQAIVDACA